LDTEAFAHDPYVDYLRARIEIARGDSRAGEQRLSQLLPRLDRAATQFWLGVAHEMQGDFGGAARRFEMAWRRDTSWIHAALALIRLDRRRGDWQSQANHARRLANAMPGVYEGWEALAEALVELGQGEGAERIAVRMMGLYPDRSEPHLLLARAMTAQGRHDEALLVLVKAIELQPTPELHAERALMLGLSGRIEDGLAEARASLARHPDSAQLYWTLASLLFANQEGVEGAEAIDRALELAPQQPGPLRTRCEYRQAAGRHAAASADCRRYIALRPDDPEAHYQLALSQATLGETDGAIAAYRRVIELDARDFRPRNNLAELLTQQGDLEGALDEAQHAYRLAENNPYVLDTLGYLYLQKGLVERAASLLEASHAADPEITGHAFHLALAYQAAGRDDEARRLLEQLRKSSRQDPKLRVQVEEALHSTP
jgi:tetratricopeptide (TPR) repeat protein